MILPKKLLDEVNYSFKTTCSQTTVKNVGNLSICQYNKQKTFFWVKSEGPQYSSPNGVYTNLAGIYFCLTRDISFDRFLVWIRKNRGCFK